MFGSFRSMNTENGKWMNRQKEREKKRNDEKIVYSGEELLFYAAAII